TAHWIEYLDLARSVLAEPVEIIEGTITARGHGIGLSWNEKAVAKHLV
ncbi:MAG: mandelate racemase, partial [Bradyrhizobium sp.]|nr:mandelate racemase [Bradyrhizobium sp.]